MSNSNEIIIDGKVTIPLSEIDFQFSPSSGPGGQHANRSSTRATLIFDVANSSSLDEKSRKRLLKKLASRLDKDGVLQVQAQDTRSQIKNREIALERFVDLLSEALKKQKKRIKTKPSLAALKRRKEKKKKRSRRKKERGKDWSKEI